MNTIKQAYSYLFGKKQADEVTGTEDVKHVTEITKKRKKRVKTEARKLKEKINKKRKNANNATKRDFNIIQKITLISVMNLHLNTF